MDFFKKKKNELSKKVLIVDDSPAYVLKGGEYYRAIHNGEQGIYKAENMMKAQERDSTIPEGITYVDMVFNHLLDTDYIPVKATNFDDAVNHLNDDISSIIMGTGVKPDDVNINHYSKLSEYFDTLEKTAGDIFKLAQEKCNLIITLPPFNQFRPLPEWLKGKIDGHETIAEYKPFADKAESLNRIVNHLKHYDGMRK